MAAAKKQCFLRFLYLTEFPPPFIQSPRFTNDCKFGISVSTYLYVSVRISISVSTYQYDNTRKFTSKEDMYFTEDR